MRSGALLLKSEDGRYVEAPLVATDVDLVVSGPTARARVTQIFHNPTDGWVEAVYVYPLPEGGAVDTPEDGDRRARHRRRHQGPQAGARGLRAGEGRRPQGQPGRAGAAEHLHQLGRQYRAARDRGRADRVPGAGAAVRQRVLAARAAGRGAALHPGADRADRRPRRRRARLGPGGRPGARSRPHRAAGARPAHEHAPVNPVAHHRAPAGRLPARRGEEPSPRRHDRDRRGRRPPDQARGRPGAGGPRLRADLEAGAERCSLRSACSASASATPTTCSPS